MKFISHRGNTIGRNPNLENVPIYIKIALDKGFDVEVDVWVSSSGQVYLGHDEPGQEINFDFLKDNRIWCHAKNINALNFLLKNNLHCFWHETDKYTITSFGYIWAYPNENFESDTIAVLPERFSLHPSKLINCSGICSDFIDFYKKNIGA